MSYAEIAQKRAQAYRTKVAPLLLAIESSCDETAAAVLRGGHDVLAMQVHSQIEIHREYGGVVPEIASRSHVERIGSVVDAALKEASCTLGQIDAIAVTHGPGLVGALLVGLSYAKGLALASALPLVGVNHIAGHIAANYLSHAELKPPFVCLVASGGHSHIVLVEDYLHYSLLGRTRDDAAGEAFDKVARALSLPYPGGPELECLARLGNADAYALHAGFNAKPTLEFSFSGIKTAVINILHTAKQRGESVNYADIAASFQKAVVNVLSEKSVMAAKQAGVNTLALAGGVSANETLRQTMRVASVNAGLKFYVPVMRFCTDNAAMIGCAGHHLLMAGHIDALSLNASPSLALVAE